LQEGEPVEELIEVSFDNLVPDWKKYTLDPY